jgi:hypothetical protein
LAISFFNKQTIRACAVHKSPTRSDFFKILFSGTSKLSLEVSASRLRHSIHRVHVPHREDCFACLTNSALGVLRRGSLPGMSIHSSMCMQCLCTPARLCTPACVCTPAPQVACICTVVPPSFLTVIALRPGPLTVAQQGYVRTCTSAQSGRRCSMLDHTINLCALEVS